MVYIGKSEYMQEVLSILNAARISGTAVILWGPPGTGKTSLIKALSQLQGVKCFILLGSIMDPTDLSGLPVLVERIDSEGNSYHVTNNTRPDWADELIKDGVGTLFLDELNNAVPAVQSAELSLIQDGKVGNHTLPKGVWIVAASNEEEDAADGYVLSPPMANRLMHINWNPPKEDWFEGMSQQWGEENVPVGVQEWRLQIVGFLRGKPELVQQQPDDETKAGKAWPSRRSWDNAAKALGAPLPSLKRRKKPVNPTDAPEYEIIPQVLSKNAQLTVLKGFVGEAAANDYFAWRNAQNLPTNDEVLNNPESINWRQLKADVAYTILSRMIYMVTAENVDKTFRASIVANNNGRQDMVYNLTAKLLTEVGEKGLMKIVQQSGVLREWSTEVARVTKQANLSVAETRARK